MQRQEDLSKVQDREKNNDAGVVQPPLTPMIDVTFQLLLYFLLTSEFREDEGQIPGTLYGGGPGPAVRVPEIEITLQPTGDYFQSCQYTIENRPPVDDPESLRLALADAGADLDRNRTVVKLRCMGAVRWKYLVEAYNAAVFNRFSRINLPEYREE